MSHEEMVTKYIRAIVDVDDALAMLEAALSVLDAENEDVRVRAWEISGESFRVTYDADKGWTVTRNGQ